jgi:CRISPR/Cas system-associated endoribonuclease Cas2
MLAFGAPLQYSVFVCDLTAGELVDLRLDISSVTNLGLDSVMIVPLGAGYDASVIEFMGARRDLPSGGPSII